MYARDTSKKIRSAFISKMNEGQYIGNFAPYGYRKNPENKNHLLIDEEIAPIIKNIFAMASQGYTPSEIVEFLKERSIPTPAIYRCQVHKHLDINKYSKRQEWTSGSIVKILRNPVYLGHMAQKKTTKISFKSKKTIINAREDWVLVEDTHEPIISRECFEMVRRRAESRTCERKNGFVNVFSGIAKCANFT